MAEVLFCANGHLWGSVSDSPLAGRACPVCGAVGEVLSTGQLASGSSHTDDVQIPLPSPPPTSVARVAADLLGMIERGPAPPHPSAPQLPGYEIREELGWGGMGVVYKARQVGLNRLVALKMIRAGAHATQEELARFRREAEAVAQLQQPNIVQIYEIGEHAGLPYFSMEYVEGGSLDKQQAGTPQPPPAAAALVETLARAIHVAHQHGIIHRDLKPANILLQRLTTETQRHREDSSAKDTREENQPGKANTSGSGSSPSPSLCLGVSVVPSIPKITDFGLAKQLTADAGLTESNLILGTPSYMAPEQAWGRRHEIGPATDVYALGAILYQLTTGRPPFLGTTAWDTVLQVRSQEPVAPRRLQPRLARDLETICLKCLRKEPAKRYATAKALADDLHCFLAGEPILARPVGTLERTSKWVKRHPTAAALVGVLVTATLGLAAGVERHNASLRAGAVREGHLSQQANTDFLLALEAINQQNTNVSENLLLNEPGLQPLRRQLLETARDFYLKLARQPRDDPRVRGGLGRALGRLGILTADLGTSAEALDYLQSAREIFEQLRAEHPADQEPRRDLAITLSTLGRLYQQTGQWKEAEAAYQQTIDLEEPPAGDEPLARDQQRHLASSYGGLGSLYHVTGRMTEAESAFRRAVALLEDLARTAAPAASVRHNLAVQHRNLGNFYFDLGRVAPAEAAYRQALDLNSALARHDPQILAYQRDLAAGHLSLGRLYQDVGRSAEAVKSYQQSLAIKERLARDNPAVVPYQADLAHSATSVGKAYLQLGQRDRAEAALHRALGLLEKLAREYPEVPDYQRGLAACRHNLGLMYLAAGQSAKAEAALRQALELKQDLQQRHPTNNRFLDHLAESHEALGRLYRDTGQATQAEEAYQQALALRQQLVHEHPDLPDYQRDLAASYYDLGQYYRDLGRTSQAREAHAKALEMRQRLARAHPALCRYQRDLATSSNALGILLDRAGELAQAETAYRNALEIKQQLARDNPTILLYQADLANSYNNLGITCSRLRRHTQAEQAFQEALVIQDQLAREHPADRRQQSARARTYHNLALVYKDAEQPAKADASYRQALAIHEELARKYPQVITHAIELGGTCTNLGNLWNQQGELEHALEWYARAVTTLERVLTKDTQRANASQTLCQAHEGRADTLTQLGRHPEALREWERALALADGQNRVSLRLGRALTQAHRNDHAGATAEVGRLIEREDRRGRELWRAARVYAVSATIVLQDEKLEAPNRQQQAEQYGARAVALLRKACASGDLADHEGIARLKSLPDLAGVRGRKDFSELLHELERKTEAEVR